MSRAALDKRLSAPVSLGGLFGGGSSSEEDAFDNEAQEAVVVVGGETLRLLERPFHPLNANAVWPGAYVLADWAVENHLRLSGKRLIELGSATGAFALFAARRGLFLTTSDCDDDEVEHAIAANFALNNLPPLPHLALSWGTLVPPWARGAFHYVLASDILLYVKSYPALVDTLEALCSPWEGRLGAVCVMSWQRRLRESDEFFALAARRGFRVVHLGRLVYELTWTLPELD